jgi:hypothetical protein
VIGEFILVHAIALTAAAVAFFVALLVPQCFCKAETPLPLSDNAAAPYMGIYEGVPKAGGIDQVDEYAAWLNRKLIWGHGSEGWDKWAAVENPRWLLVPWGQWVSAMPGRRVVFSVPMIPLPPKDGPAATLKEGATGAYNAHFTALAAALVQNKLGNSIIRLGWEFDGGWYPWKTQTLDAAADYAKCFHQVVIAMRAVPGAEKLQFCWNGALENRKYELQAAYPGDDVVDYVGLDIYDKLWTKGIYPCPDNAPAQERLDRHKKAWTAIYTNPHGIKAWIDFAHSHNKPVSIPEWGLWSPKDHGGGDDPYFVQQMHDLIQNPDNHVYEAAYWDSREAKVIPPGGKPSQYPQSAELFRKLFSLSQPAALAAPVNADSPAKSASLPALGVWEPMYQGVGNTEAFSKWLSSPRIYSVVTQYVMDDPGWPNYIDKYWVDPAWSQWVNQVPGRRTIIFISLPTDSPSLEMAAKGSANEKAAAMAKYLVANHLQNSIICMGLMNSPNTWDNATAKDAGNFVLAWQQIVKAIRAVPDAQTLQFDWVGMNRRTRFPIESAYPGDAYVDYIGMILYDQCMDKQIYPIPADATPEQVSDHQAQAWDRYYYPAATNGLLAWSTFAKAHGKPFSIPLWCLYSDHFADGTQSTGGDNTVFIQKMHDFIADPVNSVSFHCYMDIYCNCTRLSSTKEFTTSYPKSAELFHHLFGDKKELALIKP